MGYIADTVRRLWYGKQSQALATQQDFMRLMVKMAPHDLLPPSFSGKPLWSNWDTQSAITSGLKKSTFVYVCIMRNANAIASLPLKAQRQEQDGRWVDAPDTGLQMLLDRPNAFWSRQHWIQRTVTELFLSGNSLICKLRVDGTPVELWNVLPNMIAPVPTGTVHIKEYLVRNQAGQEFRTPAEDIVHLQFVDPSNFYWGMSPMQAAARAIDTDVEAASWQKTSLENFMVPPGLLAFRGNITDGQFTKLRAQMKEQYQGQKNARLPLMLGNHQIKEVDWKPLSLTPQEVDFMETRKLTREEICAVMGVPPPIAGILERATYSNIETARQIWWEDTLLPLTELIEQGLTIQLAPEMGEGLRVKADTSKVVALLPQQVQRIGVVKELWSMGVPFNVASDYVGLGLIIPGGDVGYIPANLVEASDAPGIMSSTEASMMRNLQQSAKENVTKKNGQFVEGINWDKLGVH
jgi:HK97 family phage portal protein